jgi:hypothetical protein
VNCPIWYQKTAVKGGVAQPPNSGTGQVYGAVQSSRPRAWRRPPASELVRQSEWLAGVAQWANKTRPGDGSEKRHACRTPHFLERSSPSFPSAASSFCRSASRRFCSRAAFSDASGRPSLYLQSRLGGVPSPSSMGRCFGSLARSLEVPLRPDRAPQNDVDFAIVGDDCGPSALSSPANVKLQI